jgi:hypothetical protein
MPTLVKIPPVRSASTSSELHPLEAPRFLPEAFERLLRDLKDEHSSHEKSGGTRAGRVDWQGIPKLSLAESYSPRFSAEIVISKRAVAIAAGHAVT